MSIQSKEHPFSSKQWERAEILTCVAVGSLMTAGVITVFFGAAGLLTQAQLLPGAFAAINAGVYGSWILVGVSGASFTGACVLGVYSCLRRDSRGKILLDFEQPQSENSGRVDERDEEAEASEKSNSVEKQEEEIAEPIEEHTEESLSQKDDKKSSSHPKELEEKVKGPVLSNKELFHSAVLNSNFEEAKRLWDIYKSEISLDNPHSNRLMTVLHLSIVQGNRKAVAFLLELGADRDMLTFRDKEWLTPLKLAIQEGQIEIALDLINSGADFSSGDKSVIDLVIQKENSLLFEAMVENDKNLRCVKPIYQAITRGDDKTALSIIHLLQNEKAREKCWPIIMQDAALFIVISVIRYLLENGFNWSWAKKTKSPFYPLHLAVLNGNEELFSLLIAYKVDLNKIPDDSAMGTPLHACMNYNRLEFAKILIKNGAEIDKPDAKGRLPFDVALERQNVKAMELLFENHATVDLSRYTEGELSSMPESIKAKLKS